MVAQRISRTKLARHAADELMSGRKEVIREIAAYLIESGRTGEVDLVIRSIYDELEMRGIILAEVTLAHELTADMHAAIKQLTGAEQLEIRETINPDILGGIRVSTPSRVLDATLQQRLATLRERKV